MHIRKIDLNLAAVFDAIFAEGSLSLAAARLGMSQSAVSHALARLRKLTDDDLFVRTRYGVKPTPHAIELAEPMRAAVDLMQMAFSARFDRDPQKPSRTFTLDLPVGFDSILIPPLLTSARQFGINARLQVNSHRAADLVGALRLGDSDLALDYVEAKGRGLICELLYKDPFKVCARKGHPDLVDGLSEAAYRQLGHVALNWARTVRSSPVDTRLTARGIEREVVVSLPTLAGCVSAIASSNLLFTIHERVAHHLAAQHSLQVLPMPIGIEPLAMFKIWHERSRKDAGHRWMRSELQQTVQRMSRRSL